MKLLRLGAKGAEKPALLAEDGSYRDLSALVPDLAGWALTPEGLAKIRAADWKSLPVLDQNLRIGPCVGQVGKFMCIGLNYADHAAETGAAIPAEPILFMKATSAIIGPNDDVILPKNTLKPDWEVDIRSGFESTQLRYQASDFRQFPPPHPVSDFRQFRPRTSHPFFAVQTGTCQRA